MQLTTDELNLLRELIYTEASAEHGMLTKLVVSDPVPRSATHVSEARLATLDNILDKLNDEYWTSHQQPKE